MKRPCTWCGIRPAIYLKTEHCSYACWAASLKVVQPVLEEPVSNELEEALAPLMEIEEKPESSKTNQLDFFLDAKHLV